MVSSWLKQGPRFIIKFPRVRPPCLDVICGCGTEKSFQSVCVQALSCGQTNPRDVFDFQEHLQSRGFVPKGSRVGVWSSLVQVSPLTGHSQFHPWGALQSQIAPKEPPLTEKGAQVMNIFQGK